MTNQPHKVCPKCQQRSVIDAVQCGRCGHQYRTQFAADQTMIVAPQPHPAPHVAPTSPPVAPHASAPHLYASAPYAYAYRCIVCGNEDIQKVSALFNAGTWAANSVGFSVGGGHIWGGPNFTTADISTTATSGATSLAQALAPPQPPRQEANYVGCAIAAVAFLGFIALCSAIVSPIAWLFVAGCAVGLFALVQGFRRESIRNQLQYQMDFQRFSIATQRWEALFYCRRCDHVFNLTTGEQCPSAMMHAYLFS